MISSPYPPVVIPTVSSQPPHAPRPKAPWWRTFFHGIEPGWVFSVLAILFVASLGGTLLTGGRGSASAAGATTTHLTFDIVPFKPGGPANDWPAYIATSPTALPANTIVTVTIRNFDLGDDALPADSPFLDVQGTLNGAATADGTPYTAVDANHITHTFTIPQLHLNVPISGDPVGDANHVTVSFRFRTPQKPGTYTFYCYVPCGTGTSGFEGPMQTPGYMRGTLTVVA